MTVWGGAVICAPQNVTETGTNDDDDFLSSSLLQTFLGGGGLDTVDCSLSGQAIAVDMANGGTAGDAAGDTYDSIERITGTDYADHMVGDDRENMFVGNGGDDYLDGGANDDLLFGGLGDDVLYGGTGSDTYLYLAGDGNDVIHDRRASLPARCYDTGEQAFQPEEGRNM